jgi:hypothetical protein
MVAQLLCVQSFLLMWKEGVRNKCLLSSVYFTLYVCTLWPTAYEVTATLGWNVPFAFTLISVTYS